MSVKASSQISLVDITDAYSVTLTSESFTFVGNTTGAPAGLSCTTQAVAYCGTTQYSKVTIGTVTCPSGISATVSNNNTALPTITFKTTATITAACEATIPVVVDGVTINKKFSFAVAMQGEAGNLDDLNVTEKLNSELKIDGNKIDLTTGHFTINSKNMTLDEDGNATFSGTISGASGDFTKGFNVNIPTSIDDLKYELSMTDDSLRLGLVTTNTDDDAEVEKYTSFIAMHNGTMSIKSSNLYICSTGIAQFNGSGAGSLSFSNWSDVIFGSDAVAEYSLNVSGATTLKSTLNVSGLATAYGIKNYGGYYESYYNGVYNAFFSSNNSTNDLYIYARNRANMTIGGGNYWLGVYDGAHGANMDSWYENSNVCMTIRPYYTARSYIGTTQIPWYQMFANGFINPSDRRLKHDIEYLTNINSSTILNELQPCVFKYNSDDTGVKYYGFIAQDVESVLTKNGIDIDTIALITKDDTEYYALNYMQFIPLIIDAYQEQYQVILELKNQISKLENITNQEE